MGGLSFLLFLCSCYQLYPEKNKRSCKVLDFSINYKHVHSNLFDYCWILIVNKQLYFFIYEIEKKIMKYLARELTQLNNNVQII